MSVFFKRKTNNIETLLRQLVTTASQFGAPAKVHKQAFASLAQQNPNVKGVKPLTIRSDTFTYLLETTSDKLVVKYPCGRESKNLELLKNIPESHAQKFITDDSNWFVKEYIQGKQMNNLLREQQHNMRHFFDIALQQLVRIHCLINDKRLNTSALVPERMESRLQNLLNSDIERTLKALSICNQTKDDWINTIHTLQNQAPKLFSELINPDPTHIVLGHGDYKPDNLIFVNATACYPIDWVYMGKYSCWYDLGYFITIPLDDAQRYEYMDNYVQEMRKLGFLNNLDDKQAKLLYLKGRMCAEVTMAGTNARHVINNRPDINEFVRALDELTRLFSIYQSYGSE